MIQIISALEKKAIPPQSLGKDRKYRQKYKVCYQSTPNCAQKYGNIKCPLGTICRPSIENLRRDGTVIGGSLFKMLSWYPSKKNRN